VKPASGPHTLLVRFLAFLLLLILIQKFLDLAARNLDDPFAESLGWDNTSTYPTAHRCY
jgi:hypothetical protein